MDLRLIILRTISNVWSDPDLRNVLEQMSPSEVYDYFTKEFNYKSPFINFGVKFLKPTAVWNFYGDNQWTKPEDETITITLPSCINDNSFDETERLFEYYSHFPTFFGLMQNGGTRRQQKVQVGNANTILDSTGTDFHGNDYDLGVSEDSFLSFGGVIMKVIAAAWSNKELMNKLDYNFWKNSDNKTDAEYFAEIKSILNKYYHFDFPWAFNLKIIFTDNDDSFWTKTNGKWTWRNSDDNGNPLIRNVVSLEIPQTPVTKNESDKALALARYNMIGPAYPFTCS